jgi:ABC-type sugar transport system ATPase subunit
VSPATTIPALECAGLTVRYGARRVLRALDLAVGPAEAVAVLGPSGCGKTTLLYTVAGVVRPESGALRLCGRLVADGRRSEAPEQRGVGVVFQNYALWPHLDAVDNVAYPLRRDGVPRDEARRRAVDLLDRMGIADLARRRPAQLSGGEQQRVGVARALARRAPLYLFDEPTAHLDTALRRVLQDELAGQRAELGAAIVYATHDVAEAFAIADRVALLRDGAVLQLGAPQEVYERPVDLWAARLTGPAATLELPVADAGPGCVRVSVGDASVTVPCGSVPGRSGLGLVLVRPEWGGLGGPLAGRVAAVRYRGSDTDYRLDTPAGTVEVREPGGPRARVGEATGWSLRRAWLLGRPDGVRS